MDVVQLLDIEREGDKMLDELARYEDNEPNVAPDKINPVEQDPILDELSKYELQLGPKPSTTKGATRNSESGITEPA